MGERKEILFQLYTILDKTTNDVRIYFRIAEKCKRAYLNNFFKKLSHQKRIFCRRIKYEIGELEKETALPGNPTAQIRPPGSVNKQPPFTASMGGLIAYCDKREQEYLQLYKTLLSNTHLGNIREMLLNQKHAVQLTLNEIKAIENKLNYERNGEEVNYS